MRNDELKKEGTLNIGLNYYQEAQWLSAVKLYGVGIMAKSLLLPEQKEALTKAAQS